jgi:uncharacterized protein
MNLNPGGEIAGRPRLAPDRPLPPYSYVSGHAPHPVSHPDGHLFGSGVAVGVAPLDPLAWHDCEEYLYGIDLFNHGYYWEAHEAWEAVWHAAGRTGVTADFLKGLIKLAAAGVKAREASPAGAARHARRCRELVEAMDVSTTGAGETFAGLRLPDVADLGEVIAAAATDQPQPLRVYDAVIRVYDHQR